MARNAAQPTYPQQRRCLNATDRLLREQKLRLDLPGMAKKARSRIGEANTLIGPHEQCGTHQSLQFGYADR